ncbi:uncharacterized protein METZ01_LOCUS280018, partial [marine metagenome]
VAEKDGLIINQHLSIIRTVLNVDQQNFPIVHVQIVVIIEADLLFQQTTDRAK